MGEHLIFFDSECPFCHKTVRHLIEIDTQHLFLFAPLNGETAKDILTGPQQPLRHANSLVLVENYESTDREFWIRSQAVFRIYWLLGGAHAYLGLLSFLPSFLGDPIYNWFAAHRHQFKLKMPEEPGPEDRFLP
ncbi:MAG TPA: DUF393 domain-containing protein [Chlamydiales bacterium]|nr:DUF393 domain-containing protein [Chlamydiales bacterium]